MIVIFGLIVVLLIGALIEKQKKSQVNELLKPDSYKLDGYKEFLIPKPDNLSESSKVYSVYTPKPNNLPKVDSFEWKDVDGMKVMENVSHCNCCDGPIDRYCHNIPDEHVIFKTAYFKCRNCHVIGDPFSGRMFIGSR